MIQWKQSVRNRNDENNFKKRYQFYNPQKVFTEHNLKDLLLHYYSCYANIV